MGHHVNEKELKAELLKAKYSGDMSSELIGMISITALKLFHGFHFRGEYEDFEQQCYLRVLEGLRTWRSEFNSFNWLTCVLFNEYRAGWRDRKRYQEILSGAFSQLEKKHK